MLCTDKSDVVSARAARDIRRALALGLIRIARIDTCDNAESVSMANGRERSELADRPHGKRHRDSRAPVGRHRLELRACARADTGATCAKRLGKTHGDRLEGLPGLQTGYEDRLA